MSLFAFNTINKPWNPITCQAHAENKSKTDEGFFPKGLHCGLGDGVNTLQNKEWDLEWPSVQKKTAGRKKTWLFLWVVCENVCITSWRRWLCVGCHRDYVAARWTRRARKGAPSTETAWTKERKSEPASAEGNYGRASNLCHALRKHVWGSVSEVLI